MMGYGKWNHCFFCLNFVLPGIFKNVFYCNSCSFSLQMMKRQQNISKMKAKRQKTQQEYFSDEINTKMSTIKPEHLTDETIINEIKQRKLSTVQLEELTEFIHNELNHEKISSLKLKGSATQPKPNDMVKNLPDDVILNEIKCRKISRYLKIRRVGCPSQTKTGRLAQ